MASFLDLVIMDSGNSGSVQSSSGGDDEFDSRSDHHHSPQIPSFLSSDSSSAHHGHISAVSNQNLSSSTVSLHHHHLPSAALFDPSSSYLQALSYSNSMFNMDLLPSYAGTFARASPSIFAHHHQQGSLMVNPSSLMHSRSSVIQENGAAKFPTSPSSDHIACPNQTTTSLGVRNPKKRTRASRRTPTTVMTTDTSNFRAMVQEFTGIPAPPFSGTSYSRRLDLLGSSGFRSGHLDPMGSLYQPRPSSHKILPSDSSTPPHLNSSALPETSNNAENTGNFTSSGPASNYPNMQNPSLSFQSLLQPLSHQQMLSSPVQVQLGTAHGQASGGVGSGHRQLSGCSKSDPQQRGNDESKIFDYDAAPSGFDHQNSRDGTFDSWISHSN